MTFYSCSLVSVEMSNERAIRTRWLEHCFHQLGCFDALCQQTTLAEVIVLVIFNVMTLIFPGHVLFIETELLPAMACCNAAPGHTGNCQIVSRKEGSSSRMDGAEICTYQAPAVWYFRFTPSYGRYRKYAPTPQI
jgi:hypothetical protein